MKKNIVRKHNAAIEACFSMSTSEMRVIYSCISKIGFREIIDRNTMFAISAKEYATTFSVDIKNAHRQVREAVDKIWGREVIIKRPGDTPLLTRWISAKIAYSNGSAEIRFATDIIPYLVDLAESGNFTMYRLESIAGLTSSYALRLYEFLKQYEKLSTRRIELTDLRGFLCLNEKYQSIKNLKARVLDPSISQINKNTDILVSYENIRKARKIIAFNFIIEPKKKNKQHSAPRYIKKSYIQKHARPGESWDEAKTRLGKSGE